jgi:hypothetical protein
MRNREALMIEKPEVRYQQKHMLTRGFNGTGGERKRRTSQYADHLLGIEPADVVLLENLAYATRRELGRLCWSWCKFKKRPKPRLIRGWRELKKVVKVAVELLAELATVPLEAEIQLVVQTRKLAQTDQQRSVHSHGSKTVEIRPKRVGEDESIFPIILGARREIAIAKTVQLFRIDGKYAEPTFQKLFH